MITGFYVASLCKRGLYDRAICYLEGIHEANAGSGNGKDWSFPEYLHGKDYTPKGTQFQGWSASAAVMARHAILDEKPVFQVT